MIRSTINLMEEIEITHKNISQYHVENNGLFPFLRRKKFPPLKHINFIQEKSDL